MLRNFYVLINLKNFFENMSEKGVRKFGYESIMKTDELDVIDWEIPNSTKNLKKIFS